MTFGELKSCASEYRFPCGARLMVPSPGDHAAFPPAGYVAVNPQHLEFGLRFPLHSYLVAILNDLKLAPFQLTPNSYAQITSLALLFRKNELPFPTPKIFRYLYSFKGTKDELYYMAARSSDYKRLLPQGNAKGRSNVGDYKSHWFYISCCSLHDLNNLNFVLMPSEWSFNPSL